MRKSVDPIGSEPLNVNTAVTDQWTVPLNVTTSEPISYFTRDGDPQSSR